MTMAEKAGLKAYPENIGYSTIGDTMYDYNAEKRRVFVEGYEQGYKDAVRKACEWVEKFTYNSVVTDNIGEPEKQAIIIAFKEYMEEQQ